MRIVHLTDLHLAPPGKTLLTRQEFSTVADRVAVVPGNHDQSTTVAEVFTQLSCEPCGRPTIIDVGRVRVIILDTSEGYFGQNQLSYLRTQTRDADARERQILVFAHHPPCTLGAPFLDRDFAAADVAETTELLSAVAVSVQFLINDVVRIITRYGHDSTQTEPQSTDPIEIGARVERFTRIMARQYTAHLELVCDDAVPAFLGYPALVEQALINLVKNSCEALTSRDQRVCIRVAEHECFVLFQVCDQGTGFTVQTFGKPSPGEDLFATTKTQSGGTGLGISVVRSSAERHGGSLRYTGSGEYATIAELRIPVEAE